MLKKYISSTYYHFFKSLLSSFSLIYAVKLFFHLSGSSLEACVLNLFHKFSLDKNIYFLPFFNLLLLFTFLYLFFISRKLIEKCFSFLVYFVLCCFLLILYKAYDYVDTLNIFEHRVYSYEKKDHHRKVIWIIFDEFDPEIAFNDISFVHSNLPNFESILTKSFVHNGMYSLARDTEVSISGMIMSSEISHAKYRGMGQFEIYDSNNHQIKLQYQGSIFDNLMKNGFSSSIFGWYLPYCSIFKEVDCIAYGHSEAYPMRKLPWFDGIKQYSPKFLLGSLGLNYNLIRPMESQYNDIPKFLKDNHHDLLFLHLAFPHLPSNFSQKKYGIQATDYFSQYRLNLRLSDDALGVILSVLPKDKEYMLILSSDHWLREKRPDARPALFIAHINTDNEYVSIQNSTSLKYIGEFMNDYLQHKISTHKDIKKFWGNKKFLRTYSPDDQ